MGAESRKVVEIIIKSLGHVVVLIAIFYLADQVTGALSIEGSLVTASIYAVIAFLYYSGLSHFAKKK